MEYKNQLEEAEKALWQIFNVIERSRQNKTLEGIRKIITDYLDAKINTKTKERGGE